MARREFMVLVRQAVRTIRGRHPGSEYLLATLSGSPERDAKTLVRSIAMVAQGALGLQDGGHPAEIDLYAELNRVFKNIRFGPEHPSHFLTERNFGWSKDLDWSQGWRQVQSP